METLKIKAKTENMIQYAYVAFRHMPKSERFTYMDDTVTLMGNKKSLWELRAEIETFLRDRLDLRLNPKTAVYPIAQGIDFCGYRTWPHRVLPRKRNLRKARKRLSGLARLVATGQVAAGVLRQSLASLRGYLKWCTCRMPVSAGVDEGGA